MNTAGQKTTSLKQYLRIYNILTDAGVDPNTPGDVERYLSTKQGHKGLIKDTTKRNYYVAILGLNDATIVSDGKSKLFTLSDDTRLRYIDIIKTLERERAETNDQQTRTETMQANWISWAELYELIVKETQTFNEMEAAGATPTKLMNQLQRVLILSFFYRLPPLRNDYANTRIVLKPPTTRQWNYVSTRDRVFYLNTFKTVRTIGVQQRAMSGPEFDSIFTFLDKLIALRVAAKVPVKNRKFLLLNPSNNEKMTPNGLTKYLNGIFGKKIGSTQLRRIYMSHTFPVYEGETQADRLKVNAFMGHNLKTQNVYRKITDK